MQTADAILTQFLDPLLILCSHLRLSTISRVELSGFLISHFGTVVCNRWWRKGFTVHDYVLIPKKSSTGHHTQHTKTHCLAWIYLLPADKIFILVSKLVKVQPVIFCWTNTKFLTEVLQHTHCLLLRWQIWTYIIHAVPVVSLWVHHLPKPISAYQRVTRDASDYWNSYRKAEREVVLFNVAVSCWDFTVSMEDEYSMVHWWNDTDRKNLEHLKNNLSNLLLCLPQNPHGLALKHLNLLLKCLCLFESIIQSVPGVHFWWGERGRFI
jgi:hypothetical protein